MLTSRYAQSASYGKHVTQYERGCEIPDTVEVFASTSIYIRKSTAIVFGIAW